MSMGRNTFKLHDLCKNKRYYVTGFQWVLSFSFGCLSQHHVRKCKTGISVSKQTEIFSTTGYMQLLTATSMGETQTSKLVISKDNFFAHVLIHKFLSSLK